MGKYIIVSLVAALVLAALWIASTGTASAKGLIGDANCDGAVTSVDAALVLQAEARLTDSPACKQNVDFNANGEMDAVDAHYVLLLAATDEWRCGACVPNGWGPRAK